MSGDTGTRSELSRSRCPLRGTHRIPDLLGERQRAFSSTEPQLARIHPRDASKGTRHGITRCLSGQIQKERLSGSNVMIATTM